MKFYLPAADCPEQTESVYQAIINFAEKHTNFTVLTRKIERIDYVHEGQTYSAEVGKMHGRIGEVIIAILESQSGYQKVYLACSVNRGVFRGDPLLVGESEIRRIVEFEP